MPTQSVTENHGDIWLGEFDGHSIKSLYDPQRTTAPENNFQPGDIIEVGHSQTLVAPAESAINRVYRVLARYRLNPVHPVPVQLEAEQFKGTDFSDDESLTDATHLPFVTIDNEDSRDLDQALYLEATDAGFVIYYALADASWFVRAGSALFSEALKRAVTYYAPGMSVRMLPAILSEDLVSLNAGQNRRALVFRITLDHLGQVQESSAHRALIRSRAKLSYNGVQEFYDHQAIARDGSQHAYTVEPWVDSLVTLEQVGKLRIADARDRDVVNFNRREAQVIATEHSLTITVRDRNNTEKYNEQISLLCNMEGAKLLQQQDRPGTELQAVYRVHQPPLKERVADFRATLTQLIETHELPPEWQWQKREALADYIIRTRQLASRGQQGLQQTVEQLAMKTNQASEFEPEADQHHALGVDAYARFSSPMREIVGVFTHKELLEAAGLEAPQNRSHDEALRNRVIEQANEGRKLQRKIEKEFRLLALNDFLRDDLALASGQRPWRSAILVGIRRSRLYLHIDGLAMDVKVYLDDLEQHTGTRYTIDGITVLNPDNTADRIRLGDRVALQILRWDAERRRFVFGVALARNIE